MYVFDNNTCRFVRIKICKIYEFSYRATTIIHNNDIICRVYYYSNNIWPPWHLLYRRCPRDLRFPILPTSWLVRCLDNYYSILSWPNMTCTRVVVNRRPGTRVRRWSTTRGPVCVGLSLAKARTAPWALAPTGRLRCRPCRWVWATGRIPWPVDSTGCKGLARIVRCVRTLRTGWCSTGDKSCTPQEFPRRWPTLWKHESVPLCSRGLFGVINMYNIICSEPILRIRAFFSRT